MDKKEGLPDVVLVGPPSVREHKQSLSKRQSLATNKKLKAARTAYLESNDRAVRDALAELKGERFK